jgi:tetratricopeptide (TPR) repeat protein
MSPSDFEHDESQQQYFVVGKDGKRQGPMPRYRVIELLERGFISDLDSIGLDGAELVPLIHHPDFVGFFIEGDSRNQALKEAKGVRAKRNRRHRGTERLRRVQRFCFWLGVLLSPFLVYRFRFELFPEPLLDWTHARVFGGDETSGGRWAGGSSEVGGAGASTGEANGLASFVQVLRKKHPDVTGSAADVYEKGWQQIIGGESTGARQAIPNMEQAVISSEGAAWALSGLIAARAMAGKEHAEDGTPNESLLALLKLEGPFESDHLSAMAAVALAQGYNPEAFAHADDCRKKSQGAAPECLWMAAVAVGRAGRHADLPGVLKAALVAYPDSPELTLWAASMALEGRQWSRAAANLQSVDKVLGEQSDFLLQRSKLYLETGQLTKAREDFDSLKAVLVDGRSAILMQSILLYQVEGLFERAAEQLKTLAEQDLEDFSQKGEVFLHASHAARAAGRFDDAIRFADKALEVGGLRAESLLAKAMSHDAAGQLAEAEGAFDSIEGNELKGQEMARLHAWAAAFYFRSDRVRLAATTRMTAEMADPHWGSLVLLGVQNDLRLKDADGMRSRLEEALLLDLDQDAARLPLIRNYGVLPDFDGLDSRILAEYGQSPALAPSLPWMLGVVRLLQCPADTACPGAQRAFERALRQNQGDWQSHAGMARIALRRGKWKAAIGYLEPVVAQWGEEPVILAMLGSAQAGLGQYTLARETLRGAVPLDGKGTAARRALVNVLASLEEWDKAGRVAGDLWRLEPNDYVTASVMLSRPVARKKTSD